MLKHLIQTENNQGNKIASLSNTEQRSQSCITLFFVKINHTSKHTISTKKLFAENNLLKWEERERERERERDRAV